MPGIFDDNHLKLLKHSSVLKYSFAEREIEDLARLMSLRRFARDELLSREGEPANPR